jgi:hypothetical protein
MAKLDPSVAQQIAQAASAFERRRTGHTPQSVAVILSENTLVQVFLLASGVAAGTWSGNGLGEPSQKTEVLSC